MYQIKTYYNTKDGKYTFLLFSKDLHSYIDKFEISII